MEATLTAAEKALSDGDAQRCASLVEALAPRAQPAHRPLLAQLFERLSQHCETLGEHAQALQYYQRFHRLVVEDLQSRLAGLRETEGERQDALTGLAKPETLQTRVPAMVEQALATKRGLCLVRMELDPLLPSRLSLSPGLSDAVLREIGALLRAHSRAKDLALRHVGESLVLVLSDVELSSARMICERIRRAAQTHDWQPLHAELRVSLSMGLTALRSGDDVKQLLARAEAGLVSARRDGRNCVRTGVLGA
ncbi:MAG TPA: diguanylate cyclase [Roseateles sp.]|nr:diguanylate cyclase [Roseateles sp.]